MKVLLLAAGRSRRVKPIEDKNFLRFCGKTLLEHQVEALTNAGFKELVLIGGAHNLEQLQAFAESHHGSSKIQVVEQKALDDGMAGAVLSAGEALNLAETGEPILIASTNDVVDPSAYELIFKASQDDSLRSALLGKKVTEYFPGGYLEVDGDRIIGIVEKPGAGNEPSDLVNLVLHLHKNTKELLTALAHVSTERDDRYEVALNTLIKNGVTMKAIPYEGFWQPIKFPWHVFPVASYFFERELAMRHEPVSPNARVHEKAHISGNVIIDDGAKLMAGATVVGPAYIGKDSVVATNALVRESFLGERCVVGFSTEVARSFLGDDVWTHSNYLGDSIIGNDVSLGAGTTTGNLRFDEANIQVNVGKGKVDSGMSKLGLITGDHIRFGVNVSTMPGIKVGSGSLIGPGLVLNQDIEPSQYVRGDFTLKISPNTLDSLPDRDTARNKLNS